jgi:tRNA threonylcarbamoyladenosine biosynthesis protein TsaB
MNILAIETSSQICAAAIIADERLLAEYRSNIKNVHATMLFHQIEHILNDVSLTPSMLSGIAVSIGPGSFTGLRIGLSAAKGIAFADHLPLLAVPSLESLIAGVSIEHGCFSVVRKARAEEYYFAVYDRSQWIDTLTQDVQVLSMANIIQVLLPPCFLAGDVDAFRSVISPSSGCTILPEHLTLPSAFQVARIGMSRLKAKQFLDFDNSEPMYFQEFVAAKPRAVVLQ